MIYQQIRDRWHTLQIRYGARRIRTVAYLLIGGIAALFIQVLSWENLHQSSLLYMLVPYSISLLISWFRPYRPANSILRQYLGHVASSLVVLFATSMLLREGFICIVFFIPIYLVIVSVAYLGAWHATKNQNKLYSFCIPLIIAVLSLEGTSSSLSFPRDTFIQTSRVAPLSVERIKHNLSQPFELNSKRDWLLSIFPMPYQVTPGLLVDNSVHVVKTRYHRWFITNTHEGEATMRIRLVDDHTIETDILHDTTYFSSYLSAKGTRITLTPIQPNLTKITLRIDYQRHLDPAWYFHPLQQFGVKKMAEHLIEELMIRD